ncbi:hypothetical protein CCACVL1_17184 [Corchorus capsularis]|uniref:Uncharacterized protein n=1 Tax=Corchorus capsularis TaxID=210143 RepID=A0A1R3HTM6_COCAP|nr:hypothetical protein CCACVL1_17184 [Corchorus capsularis]
MAKASERRGSRRSAAIARLAELVLSLCALCITNFTTVEISGMVEDGGSRLWA